MGHASERLIELEERGFGEVPGDVCLDHLVDPALRDQITEITHDVCVVCGREDRATGSLDEIATIVKLTIDWFYGDPISPIDEIETSGLDAWDVVAELCSGAFDEDYSEPITQRITEALVEHSGFAVWVDERVNHLEWRWYKYTRFVQDTVRFVFASPTGNAPREVLELLEELKVYLIGSQAGLLQPVPAGLSLFRGRLVEDPSALDPNAGSLGPAPVGRASANRMSPAGVSLFYGSEDAQTAIAEIAGHGPAPVAVVGEFRSARTLHILDLATRPAHPGSVFDPDKRASVVMHSFLGNFVEQVTRPVIPDGREHIEYAPTQVLTEYIRWTSTSIVDGIAGSAARSGDSG